MDPKTIAVTPAYNEEGSVARVVTGVRAWGLPSVVVDDGSEDATADEARRAGAA